MKRPRETEHPPRDMRREDRTTTIPVIAEELDITKEALVTGAVRATTRVTRTARELEIPVAHEEVEIRRVEVNEIVERAPEIHRDGDTMIVPVVEEVAVVEKKLILRELVYVTTRRVERTDRQTVTLRRQDVDIERDGSHGGDDDPD